jgi:hypothetical protein
VFQYRMNHSEYLRRKLESLPKVYGRPVLADEGLKTSVRRYVATASGSTGAPAPSPASSCCGPTPVWRSRGGRPNGGPYGRPNGGPWGRAGDGQQQVWTSEARISRLAGCAICADPRPAAVRIPCVPPESTPEMPRAADGTPLPFSKAAAYRGRETCCPVVGPPLSALAPDCCDAVGSGMMNTLLANDMPITAPIFPPYSGSCCPVTLKCPNPCCDENGFLRNGCASCSGR